MPFQKGHKIRVGMKHTDIAKKKMSKFHKGKPASWINSNKRDEICKKISLAKKGKKRTKEFRKRYIGKNNPNWIDGRTPENVKIRHSIEMDLWREAIFKRDNYTCWICEARNGNGKAVYLHTHHLKRFSDYPKLRFVVSNGLTLCEFCHRTYTKYGVNSKVAEEKNLRI